LVQGEGFVRCDDWDVLHEGVRNDLPVEGIGVMCGEIEQSQGVLCRER
jgi:hypothetical protein